MQVTLPQDNNMIDAETAHLLTLPMKRYGRICDCPKDPNYSMFCTKARNWYEMSNRASASQSLSYNFDEKYAKMKSVFKKLCLV